MFITKKDWLQLLALVGLVAFLLLFVFVYLPTRYNGAPAQTNAVQGIVKIKSTWNLDSYVTLQDPDGQEIGQWKCLSMAVCDSIQKGQLIRFTPSPANFIVSYTLLGTVTPASEEDSLP